MALERRNPLPAAPYWIDLDAQQLRAFTRWRKAHPIVTKVERTSTDSGTGLTWVRFRCTEPVEWPAAELGWPNTFDGEAPESEPDTKQAPAPEPHWSSGERWKLDLGGLSGPVVLLGLAWLLSKRR